MTVTKPSVESNQNRDPITGAPGAHPIGTGVGAALGGAAAGAATGTVAGPVGTVIGAAVGAIVGGLAGKGVAEKIDPTQEEAYWRANFSDRDYVGEQGSFDDYGPAYRYGVDAHTNYPGQHFDEIESDLSRDWGRSRGNSRLEWNDAKAATRDAWTRISDTVERATPGDSDRDGK
jgi:hypothetical protein